MSSRERMSPVDTAWLRMDRPNNLMQILGVMLFDGDLDVKRLKRAIEGRMLGHRRFVQCVVEDGAGYWWQDDPQFRIDNHLKHRTVAGGGRQGRVAGIRVRPCLRVPRSGAAAVGVSPRGYRAWGTGGDHAHPPLHRRRHRAERGADVDDRWQHRPAPARGGPRTRRRCARRRLDRRRGGETAHRADRQGDRHVRRRHREGDAIPGPPATCSLEQLVRHFVRSGTRVLREIGQLALLANDSRRRASRARRTADKDVAWSSRCRWTEVKAVGKVLGCSVNDVLLSCVAGAIARLPGRPGRRGRRGRNPRHGAGEPASAGGGLASWATASVWRRWCCRSASRIR